MNAPTPYKNTQALPGIENSERTRCEVWTRVMGYHRPVDCFNTGKKGEFFERRPFTEDAAGLNGSESRGAEPKA